jgi:hypothetical protein
VIAPTQGLYLHRTTQHRETQTHIHAPSRIQTCDPNIRATEDSTCLRPLGYWDRLVRNILGVIYCSTGILSHFYYLPLTPRAAIAQSVQCCATGWTIGVLGFHSRQGLGIFLFTTASTTALGPTQPPIQWVPGALSLRLKRPGSEADHSPPSSAEVKNAWSYTSTPPIRLHGLVKHRDNFTFLPLTPTWLIFRIPVSLTFILNRPIEGRLKCW